jgi:hypothetical protein
MTKPGNLCSRIAIEENPHGHQTFRKLHEFVPRNFVFARSVIA